MRADVLIVFVVPLLLSSCTAARTTFTKTNGETLSGTVVASSREALEVQLENQTLESIPRQELADVSHPTSFLYWGGGSILLGGLSLAVAVAADSNPPSDPGDGNSPSQEAVDNSLTVIGFGLLGILGIAGGLSELVVGYVQYEASVSAVEPPELELAPTAWLVPGQDGQLSAGCGLAVRF